MLREAARSHSDKIALVQGDHRWTYAELDLKVDRLARGLLADGLEPGDRVIVQLPNVPEFVMVFFALLRAGAHPVLAQPTYRSNEITHIYRLADPVTYVVSDIVRGFDHRLLAAQVLREVDGMRRAYVIGAPGELDPLPAAPGEAGPLPDVDGADVSCLLLSSGTTAMPKMIPRTHDQFTYRLRMMQEICGFSEESVYLAALPVGHDFTLSNVMTTLSTGGTVVLAADPSPQECFQLIEREGVTITSVVPTIAATWLEAKEWAREDLSSLSLIQVGGSSLPQRLAKRVEPSFDCRLQQVFGMSEGLINFTRLTDPPEVVMTCQGRPLSPADEIKVVDDTGAEIAPGQVGELLARGPGVIRGYYRAAEQNAAAFTQDGFYRTGDLVRLTESGNIVVQGRRKDVINRAGEKISPAEVENHLLDHPAVRQAAVVGIPDSDLGEYVCAYLVSGGPAPTLPELRELFKAKGVAAYKVPHRVEIVDGLPLTAMGKVDKKALVAKGMATATNPEEAHEH
ncbi:(2,3-dihydroxybenzoyl)adenylate synthase [Streptomyces sp. NPDC019531]|uniref:(2,3-dihydroxybenzoyl)adenylate synthase n=1 Tax=Streptomyces sp. NPDC019531 TaxID=3365062 RepID=UPI00384BCE1A